MAFDKEQYFLLNVAMGGIAGAIPSSFTQASMDIDYVRGISKYPHRYRGLIYSYHQGGYWFFSGAFQMQRITGYIHMAYGTKTFLSQILLVFKISGCTDLSPNTSYTFTVATDLAGNQAAINPIVREALQLVLNCHVVEQCRTGRVCLMLDIIIQKL
jgi:hypothetical protein